MNVLLLGNTMSLWWQAFFTNPTGLLRFPAPLHCMSERERGGGGGACYIMWTCITHPTLCWKTEKAHRFKSSGIWCPCNCSIKNCTQSTYLPQISNPALSKKVPKPKHKINILFLLLLLLCCLPIFFIGWFSPSLWGIISNHTACNHVTCETCKVFTKFNTW